MKISKEARRIARELFRLCLVDGRLDEAKVRLAVDGLIEGRPRGYVGIVKLLRDLVRMEIQRHHAVVESATELDAGTLADLKQSLCKRHGADLTFEHRVRPELIGGVRIQIGSDVWDGSVRGRLETLEEEFAIAGGHQNL